MDWFKVRLVGIVGGPILVAYVVGRVAEATDGWVSWLLSVVLFLVALGWVRWVLQDEGDPDYDKVGYFDIDHEGYVDPQDDPGFMDWIEPEDDDEDR